MLTQIDRHLRADSQKPASIKRKVQDLISAKNHKYMIKVSKFKNTLKWWMKIGEIRRRPHRHPPLSKVTIT
jgi:hypothetical protein